MSYRVVEGGGVKVLVLVTLKIMRKMSLPVMAEMGMFEGEVVVAASYGCVFGPEGRRKEREQVSNKMP